MDISPLVTTFAALNCSAKPTFLGLVPWYQYLNSHTVTTDASGHLLRTPYCDTVFFVLGKNSSIPLVLIAILEDLVRVAGLVAVAYVIWGGFKYITSQGSPEGTTQARQTIINALIGLAIAIISATLVSFIGNRLSGG